MLGCRVLGWTDVARATSNETAATGLEPLSS